MSLFDELKSAFAATAGDQLVPGAAGYSLGAVATVLSSEDEARRFIELHGESVETLGLGEIGYEPVVDPWCFMRRTAVWPVFWYICSHRAPTWGPTLPARPKSWWVPSGVREERSSSRMR